MVKKENSILRDILTGGAQAVGNLVAGPSMGNLARRGANVVADIFGVGDYTVKSNSLMSQGAPKFGGNMAVRICHREYLFDLDVTTSFSSQSFAFNPANNLLFPWLSQIAQNFQQWELHGCVIYFRSTAGNAVSSTNSALGTVIIAANYDLEDAPFTNKVGMENSAYCVSGKPAEDLLHPIECAKSATTIPVKLVDHTGTEYTTQPNLYNLCNLQIASIGAQSIFNAGEIWISYDVSFYKPVLATPSSILTYGIYHSVRSTTSQYYTFGTTDVGTEGNFTPTQPSFSTVNRPFDTMILPTRPDDTYYRLILAWEGGAGVSTLGTGDATAVTLIGASITNTFGPGYTNTPVSQDSPHTNDYFICEYGFVVTGGTVNASFTLSDPCVGLDGGGVGVPPLGIDITLIASDSYFQNTL